MRKVLRAKPVPLFPEKHPGYFLVSDNLTKINSAKFLRTIGKAPKKQLTEQKVILKSSNK